MRNICGSTVCNFLHVTRLACRILMWLLDFWKNCASLLGSTEVFCTFFFPSLFTELELRQCKKSGVSTVALFPIMLVILLLFVVAVFWYHHLKTGP